MLTGTVTSTPPSRAAFSTAADPAITIRSASETCLPSCASLKVSAMPSRVRSTVASVSGSLASQPFCGSSRIRAPLAPPRLSLPRNVEADAHAVATSCPIGMPASSTRCLSAATSASSIAS
jgi:hypothetical protein